MRSAFLVSFHKHMHKKEQHPAILPHAWSVTIYIWSAFICSRLLISLYFLVHVSVNTLVVHILENNPVLDTCYWLFAV